MQSKKGQGLSISTLVIIALAVFVIFLLIGFVTTGWGEFTDMFGSSVERDITDTARLKCDGYCASWKAAGSPNATSNGYWDKKLCLTRTDLDMNGDGIKDDLDTYSCRDSTSDSNSVTIHHGDLLDRGECPIICW